MITQFKSENSPDPEAARAKETIRKFFDENREAVFYSRQIEVIYENEYFHWITNRVLQELAEQGDIRMERQQLSTGGTINLYWHRSYRFYKRNMRRVTEIVQEYTRLSQEAGIGLHAERMVLHAFARCQFIHQGENTRVFQGKVWSKTQHDLDFIFEKDSVAYGVEVKNTLNYIARKEFDVKIELCKFLNIRPVFIIRMMPRVWIYELIEHGGYAMILKHQFYPPFFRDFAKRVANELLLPVDTPKAIEQGTMKKFLDWHEKNV